jgi:hypothetical protein
MSRREPPAIAETPLSLSIPHHHEPVLAPRPPWSLTSPALDFFNEPSSQRCLSHHRRSAHHTTEPDAGVTLYSKKKIELKRDIQQEM